MSKSSNFGPLWAVKRPIPTLCSWSDHENPASPWPSTSSSSSLEFRFRSRSESRSLLISLSSSPSHSTSLFSPILHLHHQQGSLHHLLQYFQVYWQVQTESWKPRFQKIITWQSVLQSHFCKLKTKVELFFYKKVQSLGGCELVLTYNSVYQKCTLSTLDAGDSWRSRPQLSRVIAGDNDVYRLTLGRQQC